MRGLCKVTGWVIKKDVSLLLLSFLLFFGGGCSNSKNLRVLSKNEAVKDMEYLVDRVQEIHPDCFSKINKLEFSKHVERVKENLPLTISRTEFTMDVAETLALISDCHTRLAFYVQPDIEDYLQNGGKIFPLKLKFQGGNVVVKSWPKSVCSGNIAKGDSVIEINEKPMTSLVPTFCKYISAETISQKYGILEYLFYMYYWFLEGECDNYLITFKKPSGEIYQENVPAVLPFKKNKSNKKDESDYRINFYNDGEICLFKVPSFYDNTRKDYKKLDSLFDQMNVKKTSVLIVDLRNNRGGNGTLAWNLLRKAAKNPFKTGAMTLRYGSKRATSVGHEHPYKNAWGGALVVICNHHTHSAAVSLAMIVKDNELGVIAGEETGGLASYFANYVTVTMPNSGLKFDVSSAYLLRAGGYDDGRGVLPDIALDLSQSDEAIVKEIEDFVSGVQ